jgi:hypothetical protein
MDDIFAPPPIPLEAAPIVLDTGDMIPNHERAARAFVLVCAALVLALAVGVLAFSIRPAPPVGPMGDMSP